MWKSNRSVHVTTCDRGEAEQNAAIDSVPPDAQQDPRRADRHGERGRQVFPADTEHLRHEGRERRRCESGVTIGNHRDGAPRWRNRPLVPRIQLAVAGPLGRLDRSEAGCGVAEQTAVGTFAAGILWCTATSAGLGRTACLVTGTAGPLRRHLCEHRRTGHHAQHELLSESMHRLDSSIAILRGTERDGSQDAKSAAAWGRQAILIQP